MLFRLEEDLSEKFVESEEESSEQTKNQKNHKMRIETRSHDILRIGKEMEKKYKNLISGFAASMDNNIVEEIACEKRKKKNQQSSPIEFFSPSAQYNTAIKLMKCGAFRWR